MPTAVTTPARVPPSTLLRRTTAVEAPGISTSGTVTARNPHSGTI